MTNRINVNASIDRPSKQYHSNIPRTCDHDDCCVRLSVYNSTQYCSSHERVNIPPAKFL